MVLVIGHKFKLEVWENIVKMMAVGEVASFTVQKEVCIITVRNYITCECES